MSGEKEKPVRDALYDIEGWACFACAPADRNPDGMNLKFEETKDGVKSRVLLPAKFQSYPGYLHGGIVSSILDETMAYLGVFKFNGLPFTKTLKISYRAAVKVETEYTCLATLSDQGPSRFSAKASIIDHRGFALAVAEGEFVIPNRKLASRMLGDKFPGYESLFRE